MITKPQLKVKHKVEDLICFIERNDLEKVKKIIEHKPKILKSTKMDENEPIYYAIKYKANKIFSYILNHSGEINYDLQKLLMNLIKYGTEKMLAQFISLYKVDLQNSSYKAYVNQILEDNNPKMVSFLLNETNLSFSYCISMEAYRRLGYNFPIGTQGIMIKINSDPENAGEEYNLDHYYQDPTQRFSLIFMRYKKLFLCIGKSIKPPKILNLKTTEQIIKYI